MPPKSHNAGGGKSRSGEEEKEQILQAIVLADTFETKFSPFTLEKPRCLLPLLNTPLIEYTLEYLASAGVHEVYLYAGAHADQVEAYTNASKWKLATSSFRKFIFLRTVAASVGDVLRDLDQKDLMAGDFLCVSGDIVSNFPLDEALRRHKARREKDKNAIMTMLLREAEAGNPPGQHTVLQTFVVDPSKDRCLHYEEALAGQNSHSSIEPDMLDTAELDIRQDLIDCRIDICTPDVLSLWSDNFDNQALRKDFLHGVLKDYELNGKTIHTHIITNHYSSRVSDLLSYDTVSRDIYKQWASPLSVNNNIFADMSYKLWKKDVYQESDVVLARSCHIEGRTMLGKGTTIGAGSIIRNSIVGRRCNIGKNAVIEGSYVWDDSTIGNDVRITKAILADEASIGDRSGIAEGALVSFGVRVDSGTSVLADSVLTNITPHEDDEDEDVTASTVPGLVYKQPKFAASTDTIGSKDSEEDEPSEPMSGLSSRAPSMSESASEEDTFHREVVNSIFGRMQENAGADDVKVELISSRLAHNATQHQVRRAVAVALMKHIQTAVDKGSGSPAEVSRAALDDYKSLFGGAQDTIEDQVDFLLEAQKDLAHRNDGGRILLFLTKGLYDQEIFQEEVFMQWWDDEKSSADSQMRMVRAPTEPWIEWLKTAESESESDEET